MSTPSVAIATLGCRLNQAEAEAWAISLALAGYRVVDFGPGADAYVVHTCTVTHVADRKSRQRLYQAGRYRPGAVLAAGCLVRRCPEEAARAGACLAPASPHDIVERVRAMAPTPGAPAPNAWPARGQAQVKIQEGCSLRCTYCIIPRVRGRPRSRPVQEILADVRQRKELGYREVVLTGTLLGTYGRDLVPTYRDGLRDLVAALLSVSEGPKLRVSSLQPQDLGPALVSLWGSGRLVPRFHLPLQSGSDSVLSRMRRPYTAASFREAVVRLRDAVPEATVTTDLLVGFPGETESEFEESLALCRRIGFARIHVFPYSPRPGTAAACFPDQVPQPVIEERCRRARALVPAGPPDVED
ncbi:MAG: MiaB/RimO family radical SAM methylthiotransferase [Chloroflexi bacterium]|nr:MiaB/RimO family radical SAM methylthiotransferase [Chloroflexota bacterium]